MLAQMTLTQFAEELASDSPAPGGGSTAALCGALGAALVSMVCRLTIGKKGYETVQETAVSVLGQCEEVQKALLTLVDRDTEAFNGIMASFRRPKSTEEEKEKRRSAIQAAFRIAVEVPLEVARSCVKVLTLAEELGDKGNQNAASDLGVAMETAFAGMRGALMNVEINLPSLKDAAYVKEIREEALRINERGERLKKILSEKVAGMI